MPTKPQTLEDPEGNCPWCYKRGVIYTEQRYRKKSEGRKYPELKTYFKVVCSHTCGYETTYGANPPEWVKRVMRIRKVKLKKIE